MELDGRLAVPAFGDAHVHAVAGGLEGLRCNLVGLRTRQESLAAVAGYCAWPGPGRLGARRRVDHVRVPGRAADRGGPGSGDRRAAGLPAEPRSPHRLGQHRGAGAGRGGRAHARSARRADRTRRRGPARRHAARRSHAPGRGPGPAGRSGRAAGWPAGGPGAPALAGDHPVPGRVRGGGRRARHPGRVRHLPAGDRGRRAHLPRGRRAVVGPGPRAGPDRRPAGATTGRARATGTRAGGTRAGGGGSGRPRSS